MVDCTAAGKNAPACVHAYYKFYAFARPENLPDGITRDDLIARLNEQGLPCMQGSCSEMYLEKAFDGTDFVPEQPLPVAKTLGETSLMFFVHPGVEKVAVDLNF